MNCGRRQPRRIDSIGSTPRAPNRAACTARRHCFQQKLWRRGILTYYERAVFTWRGMAGRESWAVSKRSPVVHRISETLSISARAKPWRGVTAAIALFSDAIQGFGCGLKSAAEQSLAMPSVCEGDGGSRGHAGSSGGHIVGCCVA